MQYTFLINQKVIYDLGLQDKLDIVDICLFGAIYSWFNNQSLIHIIKDDGEYIEIRHSLVQAECPILGINHRDTFRKRMLKLVEVGLLDRYAGNQTENKSLYKRGINFNCFDSSSDVPTEIGRVQTTVGRGADANRQGVPTEIGTNKLLNKQITKNNNILPISPTGDCECEVEVLSKEKELFEEFRKVYRGTKRGLDTEFANFKKKHKDWKQVAPLLLPAYTRQCEQLDANKAAGGFVPQPKNLQTYINQRCWEDEVQPTNITTDGINTRPNGQTTSRTIDGVTYGNAYTHLIGGLL